MPVLPDAPNSRPALLDISAVLPDIRKLPWNFALVVAEEL